MIDYLQNKCPRCSSDRKERELEGLWFIECPKCWLNTSAHIKPISERDGLKITFEMDMDSLVIVCPVEGVHMAYEGFRVFWYPSENMTRVSRAYDNVLSFDKLLPFTITKEDIEKYLLLV